MTAFSEGGAEVLYLVQHGEARPKSESPERPLTDPGREVVSRVAEWSMRMGISVDQIRHSEKLRARQTARILADRLQPQQGVAEVPGMGPKDDVWPILESLRQCPRRMMFVGHLPFLSRMASMLLVGHAEPAVIQFQYGALVVLTRQQDQWQVSALVPPEYCR